MPGWKARVLLCLLCLSYFVPGLLSLSFCSDRRHISCTLQTETLRNQLDRTMEEFKTKEVERDAQKKQLTSVVEDLLRKVQGQFATRHARHARLLLVVSSLGAMFERDSVQVDHVPDCQPEVRRLFLVGVLSIKRQHVCQYGCPC